MAGGSESYRRIYAVVRKIPRGRLATYGQHLLAWRKRSGRLGLPRIRALIENVYDILDRVPRYVRKDRSVD